MDGAAPPAAMPAAGGLSKAEALDLLTASLRLLPCFSTGAVSPVRVILAVSGGADSLALLMAASDNADHLATAGAVFHAVTIDHALRAASAAEAAAAGVLAARLRVAHEVRRWDDGPKPGSNLQGEARRARYALLAQAARDRGAAAVMTAHHEDDQIETHALAAARRAGDRGLAAMRPVRALAPGLSLLRPFLGIPGARLRRMVAERGLRPVDDPSNRDPRFARVRLRQASPGLAVDRTDVLADIAAHQARRDAADRRLGACFSDWRDAGLLSVDPLGVVRLDARAFSGVGEPAAIDALARLLTAAAGRDHPPARAALERLALGLAEGASAATLGGVSVTGGPCLQFVREFGRVGPAPLPAEPRAVRAVFDNRFDIAFPEGAVPGDATIVPLGRLGLGNAREATLPVLVDAGGRPLAAHPALLGKLREAASLDLRERVSWRLFADLPAPGGEGPGAARSCGGATD